MLTPETHKKQRSCGFRRGRYSRMSWNHHHRNTQNNDNPGNSDDGELAEQDNDVGDSIYSFRPMHLLHVDIVKITKRSLSSEWREQFEHFVLIFSYK